MPKLRIYADRTLLAGGVRPVAMLFPFWGAPSEAPDDPDRGRFAEYELRGRDFFELADSPAESDSVVLPFEWNSADAELCRRAFDLASRADAAGRKIIVFFNSDSEEEVPIPNSLVFRTSFTRSARRPNEFALPGWSVDFSRAYFEGFRPREWWETPSVGYCGYVDHAPGDSTAYRLKGLARRALGEKIPHYMRLRGKAARNLLNRSDLAFNFIRRYGFWGGRFKGRGAGDPAGLRLEYARNIIDSDYALVVRGNGNFSYRLYEVMSAGRIGVFVDTDCALPFDNILDWKELLVWVDESRVDELADRIMEAHAKMKGAAFLERQRDIRRCYEEWISPSGFFGNLWRCVAS